MKCLRCASEMMLYQKTELQFGAAGLLGGDLAQAGEGTIPAEVYVCPKCRKIELCSPENRPPLKYCSSCGKKISFFETESCPLCHAKFSKPDPKNYIRPKNF